MSNGTTSNGASNGLIPQDLYTEVSQFVDKKTLLEYIQTVDSTNGSLCEDLKKAYQTKLKPLEEAYRFGAFHSASLDDAYFSSRPMILLIGQYSSGKSTFVKYLIEQDYPGIRIGPEPTTDKFVAVMHNEERSIIPGNALVLDGSKPFNPLLKFGSKFLNRFQASLVNAPVLKGITVIDSPGILSDNYNSDGYDYKGVIEWFAQRADRIYLFVDAHKLELSGDFHQIVQMIRAYDDKLRIVLNKTDLVNEQELIRLYGALMWFLGQSLDLKEVIQIYIGSFWGKPVANETNKKLYEFEEFRIFEDLSNLPKESLLRKANLLAKRAGEVSIHAHIISALRQKYRSVLLRHLCKKRTKKLFLKKLHKLYDKIEKEKDFSRNDFPQLQQMKDILLKIDWDKFNKRDKTLFEAQEAFVSVDIPVIVSRINEHKSQHIFQIDDCTPFSFEKGEGFDEGSLDGNVWIVSRYKKQYQALFDELKDQDDKVTAAKAKAQMLKSNLPAKVLNKIWYLSDIDRDGMLDIDEFILALYLVSIKLKNFEVPNELPRHLVPPSKRLSSVK